MRPRWLLMGWLAAIAACTSEKLVTSPIDDVLTDGKAVFRFDTFGDEAFWTGNPLVGALYVLKDDSYLRISIGGAEEASVKIQKTKALAQKALKRLSSSS